MINVRVYLYKGLDASNLVSNNTLTKHGIDIINAKNVTRISSSISSKNIKLPFRYKKISGTLIVIYITCIALTSCFKRGSTIKSYKAVVFAD